MQTIAIDDPGHLSCWCTVQEQLDRLTSCLEWRSFPMFDASFLKLLWWCDVFPGCLMNCTGALHLCTF